MASCLDSHGNQEITRIIMTIPSGRKRKIMISKEETVLRIDGDLKRLITLALEKYRNEINEKIVIQKSQLRVALLTEEKDLIGKALRKVNPVNKDLLPTITLTGDVQNEG